MVRTRHFRFGLALATSVLASALPLSQASAQIAPALVMAPPASIASAIAGATCAGNSQGYVASAPVIPATPQMAKRSALLGGEMSALDRIRSQQAQAPDVNASNAGDLPGAGLSPAVGGARGMFVPCHNAMATGFDRGLLPAITLPSPEDFLASKRIPIGSTNFDRDWQRVRQESVRGTFGREFGGHLPLSLESIEQVNRWVNSEITFVDDRELYGKADYWAGAQQTLQLRKGDCEDIAITKMQLLASAGFSRDDMFLTIARDRVRNADHAMLVVRVAGRFVILDNATDTLLDGASAHDYTPILSFNDKSAWLHGY